MPPAWRSAAERTAAGRTFWRADAPCTQVPLEQARNVLSRWGLAGLDLNDAKLLTLTEPEQLALVRLDPSLTFGDVAPLC